NRELIRVVMEIESGQRRGAPPLCFNERNLRQIREAINALA
ncbi:45508_t:CDS:1, partial [Gigaspora margarita]